MPRGIHLVFPLLRFTPPTIFIMSFFSMFDSVLVCPPPWAARSSRADYAALP
jgi:hypothetical protein